MNQKSIDTIQNEYNITEHAMQIAENGDRYDMYRCIKQLVSEADFNARYGSAACVFTVFKTAVESALKDFQDGKIDSITALRIISEADGVAKNDQRDGLLLVEKLFGIRGESGVADFEQRLFDAIGTNDWTVWNRIIFSKVYENTGFPNEDDDGFYD